MGKRFRDHSTAMAMRDLIRSITVKTIDLERPRPRYGTLVSAGGGSALVQFPNEAVPVAVNTGMVVPLTAGCVVRVERIGNDRYLTDAYGTSLAQVPTLQALAVQGGLTSNDFGITGGSTLPRGSLLSFTATSAPLATAVGASELNAYGSGAVGSAVIVSGRRYKLGCRGIYQMSALQTGSQATIRVRLGTLASAIVLNIPLPIASTGLQSFEKIGSFVGGTDVAAGSQSFSISQIGTASSTITVSYGAGQIYTNTQLSLEDIGV